MKEAQTTARLNHPNLVSMYGIGEHAGHSFMVISLGATYYALLTGRPPFSGELPMLLFQHCREAMPDPRQLVPDIPESCVRILMQATQKYPETRYQSANHLLAEVEQALQGAARPGLPLLHVAVSLDSSAGGMEVIKCRGDIGFLFPGTGWR